MLHLRTVIFRNKPISFARRFNFRNVGNNSNIGKAEGFDQYSAHSPLFMGRWGIEEQRSKIFFEHPPVPNRIAKFALLLIFALTVGGGVRTRIRRKYKKYY
jgi:hypothetical protein